MRAPTACPTSRSLTKSRPFLVIRAEMKPVSSDFRRPAKGSPSPPPAAAMNSPPAATGRRERNGSRTRKRKGTAEDPSMSTDDALTFGREHSMGERGGGVSQKGERTRTRTRTRPDPDGQLGFLR